MEMTRAGHKLTAINVTRHAVRIFPVSLLLASGIAGLGPGDPAVSSATIAALQGVAATSASNVWAVGGGSTGALILHWNGKSWKQLPSPARSGMLFAVAATSASNAWAVGGGSKGKTLIVHWNGKTWTRQPGPQGTLTSVAATSATNAWAVGFLTDSLTHLPLPLIVHWNGKTWKQAPDPGTGNASLSAVATTSARHAWAAGYYCTTACGDFPPSNHTLLLSWNGTAWRQVSSPNPDCCNDSNVLAGVAATSVRDLFVVGTDLTFPGSEQEANQGLLAHWNGTRWQHASVGANMGLAGVAVTSSANAWAVGAFGPGPLIARWNGIAWKQVPVSAAGTLSGVCAISSANAWAVGTTTAGKALILHWNGKTWK